jgi:hypothetical protein
MRLLHPLVRSGRTLAGIVLLAALVVGEVADARHHLSEAGCGAEEHGTGRDDNCACTGLHAAPLAGHAPVALAAVVEERGLAPLAAHEAAHRHGEAHAAPRAPPRS